MPNKLQQFYDQYHQQNNRFSGVIGRNNFTYWYILKTLQRACSSWQGKKVLDVGCGVGSLSFYVAAQGASVTGLDVSQRAIRIAKDAASSNALPVRFVLGEVADVPGHYDVIICSEVLEHIKDEISFLNALRQRLSPNGTVIITTPSSENWLYKVGYYRAFDVRVGHERRYTKSRLLSVLQKNGFEVTSIIACEGPLRNLLFTFPPLGWLVRFVRGPIVPLFGWFDSISAMLFGAADWQVIARRS